MRYLRAKIAPAAMLLWLGLGVTPASGQVGMNYVKATQTNIYDWRSAMINPSVSALQTGALEVGFKVLHLGFLANDATPFKAGYFIFNLPRRLPYKLTFGLQSELFHSPNYRENLFRVVFSRRVSNKATIGLGLGFRNVSFDVDPASEEHLNDPVFAKGTSFFRPDISLGATLMPTPALVIGIGVAHLNRPNVALGEAGMHLDPALSIGLKYSLGTTAVHTRTRVDQNAVVPGLSLQASDENLGFIEAGVDREAVNLLGRLHVNGPVTVGYGVEYPISELSGNGIGSHEVAMIFEFDRIRKPIELLDLPKDWQPLQPEMAQIRVVPQFIAVAEVERVDIVDKVIERELESLAKLDSVAKRRLTAFDLGISDSATAEPPSLYYNLITRELVYLDARNSKDAASDPYSRESRKDDAAVIVNFTMDKSYYSFLDSLGREMLKNPELRTVILTPESQVMRASLINSYLADTLGIPGSRFQVQLVPENAAKEEMHLKSPLWDFLNIEKHGARDSIRIANPDSVVITIFPIDPSMHNREWKFVVEDSNNSVIYSRSGSGDEQQRFVWHWLNNRDEIIPYGFYRYYVEWTDEQGAVRRSAPRFFYAREVRSRIRISLPNLQK